MTGVEVAADPQALWLAGAACAVTAAAAKANVEAAAIANLRIMILIP
jgi:hypothetical protein